MGDQIINGQKYGHKEKIIEISLLNYEEVSVSRSYV